MTMPEILRRKLMERIDIVSEPDDGEVLEEIDGLILGEEETRYLPVAQKAELRRQLFYSVRRLDVLQELLEDAGITEIMVNGYQHIFVERNGRIERYGKSFTSAEKLEDVRTASKLLSKKTKDTPSDAVPHQAQSPLLLPCASKGQQRSTRTAFLCLGG